MADPPTSFFKFIPPGFKLNLSIPISFWTNWTGGRCSKVILRRGGRQWPVAVSGGGVLGDGWRKLVRENGVKEFDFIVFKHQRKTVFDFLVFDQSTCEKPYPNLFHKMEVEEPLPESDSIHTHRSKKFKKRKRNDSASQKEEKLRLGDDRCFVSKMTHDIIKTSRLNVPLKFARSNGLITERKHRQVIIKDEAQRTWPAKLRSSETQIRLSGWRKIRIQNHWQIGDTCMFELVKHGEVPVFNHYNLGKKPIKNHMQVKKEPSSTLNDDCYFNSILKPCRFENPVLENEDKPPVVGFSFLGYKPINSHKKSKSARNEGSTRCEENDRSYFIGELKSYSIEQSILFLPAKFAKKNGLFKKGEMILINVEDERSWIVGLNHCMNRYSYIGRGWKDFRVANGLKEGDHFKLEIVENVGKNVIMNLKKIG